jgi:hypothetical protein
MWTMTTSKTQRSSMWLKTKSEVISLDRVEAIAVRPGPAGRSTTDKTDNGTIYTYDIVAYTNERTHYIEQGFATHDEAMKRLEEIFENFEK